MTKLIRFIVGIVVSTFIMAGGLANSAVAQEKAPKALVKPKLLLESDKVRAVEAALRPGDELAAITTSVPRVWDRQAHAFHAEVDPG